MSAAAVAAALAAGCARAPATPAREPFADLPPQTASREELRARLDAASSAVTSVRGKLTLGLREARAEGYRTCRGTLAARTEWAPTGSPGLYLQGYRNPLPALFTLVSDGRRFWLHVPGDDVVYTGPIARRRGAPADRGPALDARDLFRALFVQPVAAGDDLEVAEEPESYVVSVLRDGRTLRRIWLERRALVVRREVFLDAAGREELAVDRERYLERDGRLYPGRIVLTDPVGGVAVRLEFESISLDPPELGAEPFRPRPPAGARVERVPGEGEET